MDVTEHDIRKKLLAAGRFAHGDRSVRVLFLIPSSLWRPLEASWWRGKQVSIIGGDEHGNFLLRHSDGSVRLWDHGRGRDEVLAPSVRAFFAGLNPES